MRGSLVLVVLGMVFGRCDPSPPPLNALTGYECRSPCRSGRMCCPVGTRLECVPANESGTCALPNLVVDEERARSSAYVEWRYFAADDCALVEQCVTGSGWRRLLGFAMSTPNVGDVDLVLGDPRDRRSEFLFSACHGHHHFEGYASYALVDHHDTVVAAGHKQAFCLEDFEPLDGTSTEARFSCEYQGISVGWADTYDVGLDCQWIDVTDVPPGDYRIRVRVNEDRTIYESSYDDDEGLAAVTIPVDDPNVDVTAECPNHQRGPFRDCGWYQPGGVRTCAPGETIEVQCRTRWIGDTCAEDVVFRVCEGTSPCRSRESQPPRDWQCRLDPLSNPRFDCPPSGQFVLLEAPFDSDDPVGACAGPVVVRYGL